MRRIWFLTILFLVIFIIVLNYVGRNPFITDDINPVSSCNKLIEKSDILFVIPNLNNQSLNKYPQWCEEMRNLNKTFTLHGITHQYHEFDRPVKKEEMEEAVTIFENCFGYKPTIFRPPYNKISTENKALVESFNMAIYKDNYLYHPYCHCEPSLWMKPLNWIIGC